MLDGNCLQDLPTSKEIATTFGSVAGPRPSFESLLPLNTEREPKASNPQGQDEWNQVPEVSTQRSDNPGEIDWGFDTNQQASSLAPQTTNDGFRLSVLVPCDDPDTGQTKKCLLVKKS